VAALGYSTKTATSLLITLQHQENGASYSKHQDYEVRKYF